MISSKSAERGAEIGLGNEAAEVCFRQNAIFEGRQLVSEVILRFWGYGLVLSAWGRKA